MSFPGLFFSLGSSDLASCMEMGQDRGALRIHWGFVSIGLSNLFESLGVGSVVFVTISVGVVVPEFGD